MSNNFYMVLPSNSSAKIHPENDASNFKVDWETPIYLDGNWEMALYEMSFLYPPSIFLSNALMMYTKLEPKLIPITVSCINDVYSFKYTKVIDIYLSVALENEKIHITSVRGDFEVVFKSITGANFFGFTSTNIKSKNGALVSENNVQKGNAEAAADVTYVNDKYTELKLRFEDDLSLTSLEHLKEYIVENCSEIFKVVKLENNFFRFIAHSNVYKVKFDQSLRYSLGIANFEYSKKGIKDLVIIASTRAKLEKTSRHMYVYTSMIEPIIVGNVKAPLLKSIWLEDKFETSDVVFIAMEHPMYLPVASTRINNIEINIRDDSGRFINFAKDTVLSLTVHLRKVNDR